MNGAPLVQCVDNVSVQYHIIYSKTVLSCIRERLPCCKVRVLCYAKTPVQLRHHHPSSPLNGYTHKIGLASRCSARLSKHYVWTQVATVVKPPLYDSISSLITTHSGHNLTKQQSTNTTRLQPACQACCTACKCTCINPPSPSRASA